MWLADQRLVRTRAHDTFELDGCLYALFVCISPCFDRDSDSALVCSLDQQGWPEICRSMEVCLAGDDCTKQLVPVCRTQRVQRI